MLKSFLLLGCALGLILPATSPAADVYNGGFELGDFSGWIFSGNPIPGTVDGVHPHSGNYAADLFAASSPGYMEQLVPTQAGVSYDLNYFLASDGQAPNEFLAEVDGKLLFDQTNIGSQDYTLYSFRFQATGDSTNIKFGFRNDPGAFLLDDLTVTAAPEPSFLWAGAALLAVLAAKRNISR